METGDFLEIINQHIRNRAPSTHILQDAAIFIHKLWSKISAGLPCNSIKCDSDTFENIGVLYFLKYPKIQVRLHIQHAILSVIKYNRENIISFVLN